ncbi:hypothetical protein EVAR_88141_1 [Eumeta japonica]|uniref:PiggyBac transposable element-derived protein domain-containing protein n=1 Tax=Eumeta variegata TaxID=151549 RepID=A0A4C1WT09_EUMVA|nr:hypothetical protein EVAR_88141_1 [Eumeta japonica]
MSKERFAMIPVSLRFDDAYTRAQRKESDVAAPISHIFYEFIANYQKYYKIGANSTVDEINRECCFKREVSDKCHFKYTRCLSVTRITIVADEYTRLSRPASFVTARPSSGIYVRVTLSRARPRVSSSRDTY